MELKINETEIKLLLDGIEKLLKKHDEQIIAAITTATDTLSKLLDDEFGWDDDSDEDDESGDEEDEEESDTEYYVGEMHSESGDFRALVIIDDDNVSDYIVLENSANVETDTVEQMEDLYDKYDRSCIRSFGGDEEKAIAYMNRLKDSIESGVYSLYHIADGEDPCYHYLIIVTGKGHIENRDNAFVIDRYYDCTYKKENGPCSMSLVNNIINKALAKECSSITAELVWTGTLEECVDFYNSNIENHLDRLTKDGE